MKIYLIFWLTVFWFETVQLTFLNGPILSSYDHSGTSGVIHFEKSSRSKRNPCSQLDVSLSNVQQAYNILEPIANSDSR